LVIRGAIVSHGVDARGLQRADGIRDNYDLIVFAFSFADDPGNFPEHRELVACFLRCASSVVRNEGEIVLALHVNSHRRSQFETWNAAEAADAAQLQLMGSPSFTRGLLAGFNQPQMRAPFSTFMTL
jgi:hypothetical protein